MSDAIKPRGHASNETAEAGERFASPADKLEEIRRGLSAFRIARENGKSLVEDVDGVFVISWHPITRVDTTTKE